jgi:hypothetical protein
MSPTTTPQLRQIGMDPCAQSGGEDESFLEDRDLEAGASRVRN